MVFGDELQGRLSAIFAQNSQANTKMSSSRVEGGGRMVLLGPRDHRELQLLVDYDARMHIERGAPGRPITSIWYSLDGDTAPRES